MKKPMYVDEVECRVCGREMKELTDFFGQTYFECHNPHCENCGLPDRIKKLMLEDEKMNASELALMMLKWEEIKFQLDLVESEIKRAVLEIGKTQTVGRVRATYSSGSRKFDYQGAAERNSAIDGFADIRTAASKLVVDWKAVCEHYGIKDIPVESQSIPSVSLRFVD